MENTEKETTTGQLREDLEILNSRYGITVELDQTPHKKSDKIGFARHVSYDTLPYANGGLPVRTIREQLGLYPPEYIHSLKAKMIKLVRNFEESTLAGKIPEVGGVALPKQGLMYLDIGRDYISMIELIQNLHHELSHFSDDEISGFKGRKKRTEWVRLNPEGSKAYKVVPEYFSNREIDVERPEGFASLYGQFSPEEDRAEVAKLVMTMARVPGYLKRMTQNDEVLNAKVQAVLAGFRARSMGKVSGSYLEDLISGKVNESYWD